MNTTTFFRQTAIVGASVALILTPALASAAEPGLGGARAIQNAAKGVTGEAGFCANIDSWANGIATRLASGEQELGKRQQENDVRVTERKTTRTNTMARLRETQDADRSAIYSGLSTKATTDAQRQAVSQFRVAVDAAVQARRAAVDAAMQAYWQGLDSVMSSRKGTVMTARQSYVRAVQTAVTAAKASCAASTAPATVRQTFLAATKTAREALTQNRQSIDKAGPQVKALAQTRNAAVKKAADDFKAAVQKAGDALKAAFAQS